mmetsp:Transcript_47450/g.94727  ORF Transcript_47450/g.94727 Transcript_47450/m.94727 type:complete len:85 (+) Transcript_47450:1164-1418(+)
MSPPLLMCCVISTKPIRSSVRTRLEATPPAAVTADVGGMMNQESHVGQESHVQVEVTMIQITRCRTDLSAEASGARERAGARPT